jgi:hypothetical protein
LLKEEPKKEDITTEIKVKFLEEIVGINEIDFDNVPEGLIKYYIRLKTKGWEH